jgi:hypothetical protein
MSPKTTKEQRLHPRKRVYAAVERYQGREMLCLTVRDLSRGGLWVFAGRHVLGSFPIGSEHRLILIDAADDGAPQTAAKARVLRHDPSGIALRWHDDAKALSAIDEMLARLRRRP